MGLLDGGLQGVFGAAFGGLYLDGTLHRVADSVDRTTDPRGRAVVVDAPAGERIKAQIDALTETMRAAPGYTDEDVRLIVLQIGPDGAVAKPSTDDEITVGATRYGVDLVDQDPAQTYWIMRGTPKR